MTDKITVSVIIKAPAHKVWECYTTPKHIVNWNFADPSWHCPFAENEMRVGGSYRARMEAKGGSCGFDFEAKYTDLEIGKRFTYEFNGRSATVSVNELGDETEIIVSFDPETENPIEMQQQGWQQILFNFKNYTENETK